MPNLRVIYDNAANRASLSASSEAGQLVAANLLNGYKAIGWRATGLSATLTATWTSAEIVGGVCLPFCNLSSQATIRVRGYIEAADVTPAFDTGAIVAAPAPALGDWAWGTVLGANTYSYLGSAYARAWVPLPQAVKKVVIDLDDPTNPAGYIEASRLVIGSYWEPAITSDYGISVQLVDTSTHDRNAAGDLMSEPGTCHTKMSIPLSHMEPADRNALWNIVRGNGRAREVFISVFPEDTDTAQEQIYQLYGKLVTTPAMAMPSFRISSATLEFEES